MGRLRVGLNLPAILGPLLLLLRFSSLLVLSAQAASATAFVAAVLLPLLFQFQDALDDGGRSDLRQPVL